ncbi:solute carrier family 22 member 3-like [Anticarsia gemmatalis]|uniref:solute carrier family 22 member 3-like n=1 Tax=Anticarsia gemmatalis TaxID=129554 RepID=UPI003F75E788
MSKQKQTEDQMDVREKLQPELENDTDMIESVLSHVGEMGLYQKLLFIGMLPFGFFYAWVYFVQMFIAVAPQNYWCRVPELANLSMELRRNLSAPGAITGDWDKCMTFDTNWTRVLESLTPPVAGTPMVPCQHGWEFDFTDIPYETVVTERGWVCDSASYVPTAQSIFFAGSLTGGVILGWIADKFGRVPALMGANLIGGIGGVATIFTTGVWDFVFCRFLVGMALDNCFMIVYILVLEYVGARYRTLVGNLSIALFFGAGAVSLPWIAYYVADWRKFLWITSAPMFIVVLAPWLLPESARWLITRGRVQEAVKVLRRFETVNGTQIPDDLMEDFVVASNKSKLEERESFFTLFKSSSLRRTMVCMVIVYVGCALVFDGLVRLSDSFGMDFFITFTFSSATEIPAILLLAVVLDRWGRRKLVFGPMTLAGIFILIAIFVPKGLPQATLAIVARFFINMCYTTAIQWSTEILPTPFRASGSSALHMTGFIATVITPFVVYSERYWWLLPLLILGLTALVGAGISLTLPETNGQPMPQTVADGEKIIREQSLCGKPEDDQASPYKKRTRAEAV